MEIPYSVAAYAPRQDPRMAAQLGNFTIHGSREPLEEHPDAADFLAKVEIPAWAKSRIRDDLLLAGIRLSNLFPDLDHLAEEVSQLRAIGPDGEDLEA